MSPNEAVMELSLNISEDENCTFITSNLLEQTANFDEWLDKNGVHFIIGNERIADNNTLGNNSLDPLLNQLNTANVTENEAVEDTVFIHIKEEPTENKCTNSTIPKFTTLQCKANYLEQVLAEQLHVIFKHNINESKINLEFLFADDSIAYPGGYISLNEVGGQLTIPNGKVLVKYVEKLPLADDLDAFMPCLSLDSTAINLYICPQVDCQLVYTRVGAAKLHSLMHLGHKPFKCTFGGCKWAFYTSFKLRRHMESHSNQKDFVCEIANCGRRFTNIYNLNIHVKNHSRPAKLECSVKGCAMRFQTSRMREHHFKSHDLTEAPFACPVENCTRAFFLITGLQYHARSHAHKESELRCAYANCGKVFKLPCRLKEHLRAHTGQRPYVCNYDQCAWSFTSSSKLRRHQSSHKQDRKFHCTIGECSKSFLRSEHLKEHTLTHIGPKMFTCEVCSVTFQGIPGKASLYLHMKKHHSDVDKSVSSSLEVPGSQEIKSSTDILLGQAIQSLDVPSDMILGTGLIPEESLELLENGNFSTVNLRDLE